MTTDQPEPGRASASGDALSAVDPRLVAELGFGLSLTRPAPWLRALLALGEVVDDLLPMMGDWMSRWSSALSYDETDAPLVHARWTAPTAEAEAAGPPVVRAQAPAASASHSVRILERVREQVVREAPARAQAAPEGSPARPVVRATVADAAQPKGAAPAAPSSSPAALSAAPRVAGAGRTRVIEGPVAGRPPMSHPAAEPLRVVATETASGVGQGTRVPDASARPTSPRAVTPPEVTSRSADVAPAVQGEASPTAGPPGGQPAVAGLAPASRAAVPTAAGEASEGPADVARVHPAPAPSGQPAQVGPPAQAAPSPSEIEALVAAASGRARVVSRGVSHSRPDGRVAALPVEAPMDVARVHPVAAPVAPVVSDGRAQPVAPAAAPTPTPTASASPSGARPVVRAQAVDVWSDAATPAIRPRVSGRTAVPSVRGATPAMPGAPTPSHAMPAPVVVPAAAVAPQSPMGPPGPAAAPRMVAMQPPGSPEEVARLLGLPPGARPQTPPGPQVQPQAPARAPAPHSSTVTLDAAQIRSIAGVVQEKVMRDMERERARTRTRV